MSDGATSSWRALSPDALAHQAAAAQQQAAMAEAATAAAAAVRQQQQQQHAGGASSPVPSLLGGAAHGHGSAGVSPMKALGLQHDDTVVYSALSRPLPDYALTHVFSRVGPGECFARAPRPRRRSVGTA
jgi:hypothetical protein